MHRIASLTGGTPPIRGLFQHPALNMASAGALEAGAQRAPARLPGAPGVSPGNSFRFKVVQGTRQRTLRDRCLGTVRRRIHSVGVRTAT